MAMTDWDLITKASGGMRHSSQKLALDECDAEKLIVIKDQTKTSGKTAKFVAEAAKNGSLVVPSSNLLNVLRYQDIEALLVSNWKPKDEAEPPARKPLGHSRANEVPPTKKEELRTSTKLDILEPIPEYNKCAIETPVKKPTIVSVPFDC